MANLQNELDHILRNTKKLRRLLEPGLGARLSQENRKAVDKYLDAIDRSVYWTKDQTAHFIRKEEATP